MTTVAYIANEFPSPLEPYVMDEIYELRRRGIQVICCSGKKAPESRLTDNEREFWIETRCFKPLANKTAVRALRRLLSDGQCMWEFVRPVLREIPSAPLRRMRSLGHTLLGAELAEFLAPYKVNHIHAHHGYFASWMAMVAARLLRIGFSFTLHGSDLLLRGDLLAQKLRECQFCITVSRFNRDYILDRYPQTPPSKVIVQRLGVDRVPAVIKLLPMTKRKTRHCLLAVGRLHSVKNYSFLIEACAALQASGLDFICWIAGEGPERPKLEQMIRRFRVESQVRLLGHVPRAELSGYYQHADLVVMTSTSEGLPVALMEAMAHGRLVLAPAITGIPELVENRRTGFLYRAGSLDDFVNTAEWILERKEWLGDVGRAAVKTIRRDYDRQKNIRRFAEQFLERITLSEAVYESPVLQQV